MNWLVKLIAGLALAYVAIGLAMYFGQRRLMYLPDGTRTAPASAGVTGVSEQVLKTPDGESIVTWTSPARPGKPTILYFHGNAGSLAMRAPRVQHFRDLGLGVVMMSYRSYSGSSGSPSEAANLADARLTYDTLIQSGVPAPDIILYGESLGSGVASQLAASVEVGGLILDSPFTSAADVAQAAYPWLPVRSLLLDKYDSRAIIAHVRAPLLILHGARDDVIPVSMGQRLHAAASTPKKLVIFPEGGHSDLFVHGAAQAIASWLAETRG